MFDMLTEGREKDMTDKIQTEMTLYDKLNILTDAAKYDVACTSSGVDRRGDGTGMGNCSRSGICHSFSADGRCISLLKILFTNECIYDCKYCVNRSSNDVVRTSFTPDEVCTLTIEFYRRNYIEGLFLSSGILKSPDYTMELIYATLYKLRHVYNFQGYIHVKAIPGADQRLIRLTGFLADRMSVNIELPTAEGLRRLAPHKSRKNILTPMRIVQKEREENRQEIELYKSAPRFVPAGQSTQMIVGATDESDRDILLLSSALYGRPTMKRVYYSGFIPVNPYDKRLPALDKAPLVRENRLYQADWLMRFYGFRAEEIADEQTPRLDLDIDPKLAWALRNPAFFPVDVNRADYEALLRVPGIGVKSARLIVSSRRYRTLTQQSLRQIGVVMKKAQYFISCRELTAGQGVNELRPEQVRRLLTAPQRRRQDRNEGQLTLF